MSLSESQVWPRLPGGGRYSQVGLDQVDDTVDQVVVNVQDGEGGLEDVNVTVVAEWVKGSGAHAHEGSGDFVLEPAGTFTNLTSGQSLDGRSAPRRTKTGTFDFPTGLQSLEAVSGCSLLLL